jgi:LPXTG-site transpeptidase (sortase) family protein
LTDEPTPARRARRGRAALAALLVLVVAVAGSIVLVGRRDEPVDSAAYLGGDRIGRAVSGWGTTAAPPSMALTPATLPPLPLPDPLPDDPYAPTPQVVLGHLSIPKLGVEADLQEGVTLTAINRGPGHWPGTAGPGELGNMVVAGHRTTYSKPFNRLDELAAGDRVIFTTVQGTFTYEVRGTIIVPAANIGIGAQSYAHTATLFACHPKGSAAQRIVTKLRLLDDTGQPVDPDSALPVLEQGSDPVSDTTLMVRSGADADPASGGAGADPLAGADG